MQQRAVVVDDFYDDFDRVRRAALAAPYEAAPRGKYPGRNSVAAQLVSEALPRLSAIAGAPLEMTPNSGSGCFRVTSAADKPTLDIHCDAAQLSAVVFLNEAAQCAGREGTSFWRHRRTGMLSAATHAVERARVLDEILVPDSFDREKWELQLQVMMAPNRLVLFQSALFHSPGAPFGSELESARLVQVFFLVRAR